MLKKLMCLVFALAIVLTGTPSYMLAYATDTEPAAEDSIEQKTDPETSADPDKENEVSKDDAEVKTDEGSSPSADNPKPAETPEKSKKPEKALADQTVRAEGKDGEYLISVSGKLPEGASLQVTEILEDSHDRKLPKYDKLVEKTAEKIYEKDKYGEGDTLPYARFFDITILDKDGKEYEPEEAVSLSIDLKDNALDTKDVEFTAVHFTEDNKTELIPVDIQKTGKNRNADKTAVIEAESFSTYGVVYSYTVDFYYTNGDSSAEYHMNGGSAVMMSDLFGKLGIDRNTKDIKSVEFTDESLVSFTESGRDYLIKSLKPFTTGEQLTINFKDGTSITIMVEDATYKWWFGGGGIPDRSSDIYAELNTETGKLIIRPKDSKGGERGFAEFEGSYINKEDWKWDQYREYIKEVEFKGTISISSNYYVNLNNMFADCTNLTKVTNLDHFDTTNVHALARMFSGCEKLTNIDISSFKSGGNMQNMQNMFNGCTKLETVKMPGENFQVANDVLLAGMFKGCESLANVDFNGMDVTLAKTMTDMFNGCSALKELDVSSFGTLNNIVNMDGFVKGCTSLETLNISNLDNSRIQPLRTKHENDAAWGHDLGINPESTPNLKTLIADRSKVYMCSNETGSPVSQAFDASFDSNILYFTENQVDFTQSDGITETSVEIVTKRDYVDIITARSATGERGNKGKTENQTNNMYGLNTNGAGFLAPGTYKIKDVKRTDPHPEKIPQTRYSVCGMGSSEPEVTIVNNPGGILKKSGNVITTDEKGRSFWGSGDKEIGNGTDVLVRITYPEAAVDYLGKTHDVTVEIKKITFKDQYRIPKPGNPYTARSHNTNYYAGDSYYRTVLSAKKDHLEFQNYVYSKEAKIYTTTWSDTGEQRVLSNGSGTDIEFDIKIDDAVNNSTLLFYIGDLDIPSLQNWIHNDTDMCYDYLPSDGVVYGDGSEGIKLRDGNNLDTLTFADHTGLQIIQPTRSTKNYVVATGSDPDTSWSEFYVQASATGASYTWTSGIGCTTYLLENTDPPEPKPVSTNLMAEKVLEGRPWRETDKFDLAIVVDPSDTAAPLPKDPQTIEKGDLRYHYVTVGNDDLVDGDTQSSKRRQKSLGEISYTIDDLKDEEGNIQKEKTFEYTLQELSPEEGVSDRINAVTYSTEEYKAYVKVVVDETVPDKPELKIDSVTYKKGDETLEIARFTNTYNARQTVDHLAAVKDFHDIDKNEAISLEGGDFEFAIKPIGENAAIAPMPEDSTGTGMNRIYKASNINDGEVLFKNRELESDGLMFNYQDLLDAGISEEDLLSEEGVSFEYEMYEIIPEADPNETKVNNGNSTWTITNTKTGVAIVYDGIHHTRKITVRVNVADELWIEDHADTSIADFYIDKDGTKKPVAELEGYNTNMHHLHPDGDPIFVNFRFQQKFADVKVKKNWNDKNDRDGIRPSSIQADIANDALDPLDETLTVKGLFWTSTAKDQPVYKFDAINNVKFIDDRIQSELEKVNYTLEEKTGGVINGDENTGYATGYDFDSPFTLDEEKTEKVVTITNTHVPEDMYKVTYLDGDHGKSDGGTVIKKYGDKPQKNNVTPDKGYRFTGEYSYVITNKSGKVIEQGTTREPLSITVTGNIVFTPFYEKISDKDKGGEKGNGKGGTNTGDSNLLIPIAGAMAAAMAALIALVIVRKRRRI